VAIETERHESTNDWTEVEKGEEGEKSPTKAAENRPMNYKKGASRGLLRVNGIRRDKNQRPDQKRKRTGEKLKPRVGTMKGKKSWEGKGRYGRQESRDPGEEEGWG